MRLIRALVVLLSFACGIASSYLLAKYLGLPGYFPAGISALTGIIFTLAALEAENLIPGRISTLVVVVLAAVVSFAVMRADVAVWRVLLAIGGGFSAKAALLLFTALGIFRGSKQTSADQK